MYVINSSNWFETQWDKCPQHILYGSPLNCRMIFKNAKVSRDLENPKVTLQLWHMHFRMEQIKFLIRNFIIVISWHLFATAQLRIGVFYGIPLSLGFNSLEPFYQPLYKLTSSCRQELTPADLVYVEPSKRPVQSKYSPLFPEVEDVLGSTQAAPPCTLVWRDISVHIKLKGGKLKRLINNGNYPW